MRRRPVGGFTLIEVMAAMVVLMIGLVGGLLGLISSSQDMRNGQLRQYAQAIAEAKSEALISTNKLWMVTTPPAPFTLPFTATSAAVATAALGAAPWVLDPTLPPAIPIPNDLTAGAFFTVLPDGEITAVPAATSAGWASCAAAGIPVGTYCREIAITQGVLGGGTVVAPGGTAYVVWTRVSRNGELLSRAAIQTDTFVE
jgi:type II secretory pathway pseudopilin PulG